MQNQAAVKQYQTYQQQVATWGLLCVFGEDRDARRLYAQGKRIAQGAPAAKQ